MFFIRGRTLIKLVVSIYAVGIIATVVFSGIANRATYSDTESKMYLVQQVVEAYFSEHRYCPPSCDPTKVERNVVPWWYLQQTSLMFGHAEPFPRNVIYEAKYGHKAYRIHAVKFFGLKSLPVLTGPRPRNNGR
jgi:Tfp pilus assembly protein PilE